MEYINIPDIITTQILFGLNLSISFIGLGAQIRTINSPNNAERTVFIPFGIRHVEKLMP